MQLSTGPIREDIHDPESELRRIPLLGKGVNKGEREGQGCYAPVRE